MSLYPATTACEGYSQLWQLFFLAPFVFLLQHDSRNSLSATEQVHLIWFIGTELSSQHRLCIQPRSSNRSPCVAGFMLTHSLAISCTDGGFGHAETAVLLLLLLPAICGHRACQLLHWVNFITYYLIHPPVDGLLRNLQQSEVNAKKFHANLFCFFCRRRFNQCDDRNLNAMLIESVAGHYWKFRLIQDKCVVSNNRPWHRTPTDKGL